MLLLLVGTTLTFYVHPQQTNPSLELTTNKPPPALSATKSFLLHSLPSVSFQLRPRLAIVVHRPRSRSSARATEYVDWSDRRPMDVGERAG